ncbi:MAG: hypothetical protein AAF662_09710 [Pseudomonadota bacterium]
MNAKSALRALKLAVVVLTCAHLAACEDPQIYGSVGVSTGYSGYYGGYGGWGGSGMRTSISIGGRIR